MIDPERIGAIIGEALLAAALGALGAMARFSSSDRPLLTRAYLLHALAGAASAPALGSSPMPSSSTAGGSSPWPGWRGRWAMPRCMTCCCGC